MLGRVNDIDSTGVREGAHPRRVPRPVGHRLAKEHARVPALPMPNETTIRARQRSQVSALLHTPCTHRTPTPHAHQGRRVANGAAGHLQIYQDIPRIIPVYTSLYQSIPVHTSIYQSIPVYTSQYQYIPIYTSAYQVRLAACPISVFTLTRPRVTL